MIVTAGDAEGPPGLFKIVFEAGLAGGSSADIAERALLY